MIANIPVNKYQTPITEESLKSLPQEVQDQFLDCINNIQFIRNLISPNREYAKDRPRDERGRIIVDLTNPHILEDMDYFRPSAIHYEKYGCYTDLRPNGNPNSAYGKWLREERNRCWDGYVRESDGEWVTGYMYFYLNYSPIMLSKIRKGTKRADRIESLPEVWEGIYWRFHYIEQASVNSNHCAELASRGKGKSFTLASILAHIFILGENEEAHKKVTGIVTAYQKEYLIKDGVLNKFVSMANHCASTTQFPRKRLKSSLQELTWIMGYKDVDLGIDKGTQNTIIGVSSKDDESKMRGKRATKILIEEFGVFPRLIDLYNILLPSVQEGEIVFGQIYALGTSGDSESDFAGAQEIMYNPMGYNMYALPNVYDKYNQGRPNFVYFFPGYVNRKGCYDSNGVSDIIKALLEILMNRYNIKYHSSDPDTILRTIAEIPITPAEAIIKTGVNMFPVADLTERLGELDSNPREYDDVYVGDLVTSKNGNIEFSPSTVAPIREFPHKDNKIEGAIEIYQMPEIDKNTNKPYSNRYIFGCLKEGERVNTDSGLKKVEEVRLIDKLVDINGNYTNIKNIQIYHNENPVYEVKLSCIYDSTTFSEEHPIYCCTPKLRYHCYNRVQKEGVPERYYEYNFRFKKVSDLKVGDVVKSPIPYTNQSDDPIYNNEDVWYLLGVILGDGWASSNGYSVHISFNTKETFLIDKCRGVVEDVMHRKFTLMKDRGSYIEYSFCYQEFHNFVVKYFGKGAAFKHIDHSICSIPYSLRKAFILGYIDTDGCISRNCVNIVSISKMLLCNVQDWLFSLGIVSSIKLLRGATKHNFGDREYSTASTYQLNIGTEGLNEIKNWNINSMKVGNYTKVSITNHNRKEVFIKDGYIYLKVKKVKVSDYTGLVYNYECDSHTFMCNYIPTHNCDPYDDDESDTMSLGSIFGLDLWTDRIVAEYTGRPSYADDFFEICRKLCLFYNGRLNYENNKKGLFAHFSARNCLYLLTDVLEFLKDKQMMKEGFGNKNKGTIATAPINAYAKNRLRSWLLSPTQITQVIDGEEQQVTVPRLFTVRNRALIKELILYNTEGNFDRISAMGMLMLLREDRMIMYQNDATKAEKEAINSSYIGNDPFFKRNYKNSLKSKLISR